MGLFKFLVPAVVLSSALSAQAAITQDDFKGVGNIFVLNSSDWTTATPDDTVGCLNDDGWFINYQNTNECGVYTRSDVFPNTLSTKQGNCSFSNPNTPTNTDSAYGGLGHAWSCSNSVETPLYDQLYTIDGFPYVFLCFGDVACFYDAKKVPSVGSKDSLWQFFWGSQQLGITPGHIQLQLLWSKVGSAKREVAIELKEDMNLLGQQQD